jgi:iron(III) transport system substrate-binding protein
MTSFARTRILTLLVASSVALGGCATAEEPEAVAEDTAVIEESAEDIAVVAGEDDYVILYSGREESLIQPLIDVFMEESGVQVDIRYAGTSELAAQILEEGSQSPAAVFLSQDAGALGALGEAGLLDTLPVQISNRVDPAFTSTDGSWVGIVYDSENVAVADLPTDADDIVGPQWSGKVGVAPANASFQSFVTAYRVIRGETAADQWVSGLVINDPQIYEKNSAILEAVNSGEIPLGLINHYYWYQMESERGADNMRAALYFLPAEDPAAIVNVSGVGILKAQSSDLDALKLVEFLVSDQAQQYFVSTTYEYPLVPGITSPEGLPPLSELASADFDLSDLRTLADTQDLLRKYGLIF